MYPFNMGKAYGTYVQYSLFP